MHCTHCARVITNSACVVFVFAMDAVAAAALAAIVDHDCARVLQDLIQQNAALRQQLQDFQAKLRGQAFEIFELHNTVIDQSLRIARLRASRTSTVYVMSDDEE